jgi:flagellar motor component MotA
MTNAWMDVGLIRWPLVLSVVALLPLIAFGGYKVFGPASSTDARVKVWIDAILFWGGFAAASGVLGSVVGIVVAAQTIERAGAVSTGLLWGGIRVALLSSALGLLILTVAGLSWFVLQLRWRLLTAARSEAVG